MSDPENYQFVHHGDTGHGSYGEAMASLNSMLINNLRADVIKEAKLVLYDQGETFCIGDFGCADGASTFDLMKDLLSSLKQLHGEDTEFQVVYEDLPVNDFNSLFLRLDGIIPDPPSYLPEMTNVFVQACGTSFYKQCVPSRSMHIIISLLAAQWLSKRPTTYKKSIYRYPDSSEEEKTFLFKQAEKDWETFLLLRSKELKSGGRLMVTVPSDGVPVENGEFKVTHGSFFKIASSVWQTFVDEGKITQAEFEETNFNTCFYNAKQLRSPLDDEKSEVYRSGLRFVAVKDVSCIDPDYLTWKHQLEQEGVDDRKAHAKRFASVRRSYSNSVFMSGLSDSRTAEDKAKIVDDLFHRIEEVLSGMNPEDLKDDLIVRLVLIYKI